jgi:hypothetical protein
LLASSDAPDQLAAIVQRCASLRTTRLLRGVPHNTAQRRVLATRIRAR